MMPPVEGQLMPLSSGRVAGEAPPPGAGAGRRCTWASEATAPALQLQASLCWAHICISMP